MFHTTLSQGKYSTERKSLIEPKCKGQEQSLLEPKCKGQEQSLVEPKCKGQGKFIIGTQVRGTGDTVNPHHRTGLLTIVCILTSPGQKIGYDLENQSIKTGDNTSI